MAATIVGTPDQRELEGTPEADVIVTGGAKTVRAGAGDDLVCVTGPTDSLFADEGDDMVTSGGGPQETFVDLGDGNDRFTGGSRDDLAKGGPGTDQVATGNGDDSYFTDFPETTTDDTVDLGPGRDRAFTVPNSSGSLDGGPGRDALDPQMVETGQEGRWVFDNALGVATSDVDAEFAWSGFERFEFNFGADNQRVTFRGSEIDEWVRARQEFEFGPLVEEIELRGGADRVTLSGLLGPVDGGTGRDRLDVVNFADERGLTPEPEIRVDLGQGALRASVGGIVRVKAPHFEDLSVDGFAVTSVRGSMRANEIRIGQACWTRIAGRGGSDRLITSAFGRCWPITAEFYGVPRRFVAHGNSGDDELAGRKTDDRLIGGPGSDTADGRSGIDLCEAESRQNCER